MKRSLIALALAAVLPLSAQAGELNYNYVEANYLSSDFLDVTLDGYAVKGSVAFSDNWYASASYRDVSKDGGSLDETVVSLGWRHALSDKSDFLAEVGYVDVGVDAGEFGSASEDGYRVAAGLRGKIAPKFEAGIKGYYTDLGGESDGEFGVVVDGQYNINATWGITASYDSTQMFDETIGTWGIGVRASF